MRREKLNGIHWEMLPMFAALEPEIRKQLTAIASLIRLESGETLYSEGELAQAIYIVQSGGVRLVEHTSAGKAVNVKIYGQGDIFGMMSLMGDYLHDASIIAMTASEIVTLNGNAMRNLMLQHAVIGVTVIELILEHVQHAHQRIRTLAAERSEQRIARAVLHCHEKFGGLNDADTPIAANLSQRDIAEFTGTTVETVNRILRRWEELGYVALTRKQVTILDQPALQRIARSEITGYLPE